MERSQFVILKKRGQHNKYLGFVFTEQGGAMLSAVLRSKTAVKVSIQIMAAFVDMRKYLKDNGYCRFGNVEQIKLKRQIL